MRREGREGGKGRERVCCAVLCAGSLQESDYIGAASNQEVHVCVLPEGISLTPAVPCAACRAVLVVVLSWRQLLSAHNFVSGGFTSTELPVHDQFFAPPCVDCLCAG